MDFIDKEINNTNIDERLEKPQKAEIIETEVVDYKRIFYEKPGDTDDINDMSALSGQERDIIRQKTKKEKRRKNERKYIATFLIQSLICLIIIGSIIITKYASPNTFVSVSSALNGLYENNITLSDLNRLIDEKILQNEALAAFFNMNGE